MKITKTQLVALREFSSSGVRLKRGQLFEAPAAHARVLKAIGKAADPPTERAPAPAPPLYPTRELHPEPEAEEAPAPVSPTERVRRRYRRRNMTAG
jgi:hypothetical protein